MAQAVQVDFLVSGQVDSSGNRLDSGTVTFYETDGTTLKTIWEDGAKEETASNPHTLSSAGTAQVFADGIYVVVVKTSSGTTVRTITNAYFDPNDTTADVGYIDASEYGSGDDANAIGLAITAASGSDQTIILKPKNWDIDDDLTIPTNINLKYQQGAYTTVASTKTLTVSGTIEAPLYNIFRGAGTVTLDDRNIEIPSIWLISGSHDASAHYGVRTYYNGIKVASEDSTLPGHFQANDDGVNKEVFRLDRVSASPADNDTNDINFYSENDNNEQTSFGKLQYKLLDVSNGTEKGELSLWVADGTDGSVDQVLQLDIDTFTLKTASIDITTQATDIDIIDNNASALSFDASGKTGILELVSSNSSEGVKMSGYLNIGSSTSVSSVKDEDNMASNSATALSTQQSIKAYVDSQISTINTWQEVMDGANTFYTASNDGNPQMRIGATDSEELHIQTVYDSGAQTLDYVIFQTDVASGTADKGEFRFNCDNVLVATFDDGGLEVRASGSISFGAVDILTDSSGTTTLNNIDVLDATTEATIESAIDTLGNLTAASALATVGALNSGSITSGFGTIDIGASNLTAGAISAGARIITDDSTAATSTTDGSLQTDGGLSVVLDAVIGDDLILLSDAAVIHFGASKDVTMTHVADVGLTITHTGTGDNLPVVLQLKSEEDAVIADEVIASLEFAAGDSDGTDGATVAAGIHAIAEETFAADANATKLVFTAADSETAAASATAKMTLASTGNLTTAGSITAVGSFIIGSADMSETDLEKLDGITNGTATAHKAVILDVYKNIAGIGTVGCGAITSTGTSSFAVLGVSGNVTVNTSQLFIDTDNDEIGFGTASPDKPFHFEVSNTNTSAMMKIKQAGSGDPTVLIGTAATNFAFGLDNSDSDTFKMGFGAELQSMTLGLTMLSTGKVGVGVTTPTGVFHVRSASNLTESGAHIQIEGSGYGGFHFLDATAYYIGQNSAGRTLRLYSNAETAGAELAASGTSFGTFSDERVKTGVMKIENAVSDLMKLRCVKFNYKMDPETQGKRLGLIAQDLLGVFDEAVYKGQGWGDLIQDDNEYYSVTYQDMIPPIIAAIQELSEKIEKLGQ